MGKEKRQERSLDWVLTGLGLAVGARERALQRMVKRCYEYSPCPAGAGHAGVRWLWQWGLVRLDTARSYLPAAPLSTSGQSAAQVGARTGVAHRKCARKAVRTLVADATLTPSKEGGEVSGKDVAFRVREAMIPT